MSLNAKFKTTELETVKTFVPHRGPKNIPTFVDGRLSGASGPLITGVMGKTTSNKVVASQITPKKEEEIKKSEEVKTPFNALKKKVKKKSRISILKAAFNNFTDFSSIFNFT